MATVKFTEAHEWVAVDGEKATIGITDYAQDQLGDVVYIELPAVGADIDQGEEAAVVESVKAAAEVYTPVGGQITETNKQLAEDPSQLNTDAEGEGWMFKIKMADETEIEEMMDAKAYADYVAELD
ncbi:MAG: glycine cleavage system protein GcvH [Rhodospirillales bacterium]|jgi:glycine cleavage system H protein|nr:glycine cleavage system protein GcvH [Rhodospirillales bacterium]